MANTQQDMLERDPNASPVEGDEDDEKDEMPLQAAEQKEDPEQTEKQVLDAHEGQVDKPADGEPRRRVRGFATMDVERRREIASRGGQAAHRKGTAHEFTPEEAREAGRKGGERSRQRTRERMGG